ncbi:MAG TPA: NAD(P)H-hydrate dehydratase [Anaerolineae bacterium]|nr:NAD(P)H-hydrate dehydratase [Anaerolineae bacterium]
MHVVTVEQMRSAERSADASGLSYEAMMENAGRSVARWLETRGIAGQRVLVLAGPGNNGGDGLVAARYLHQMGARVSAYAVQRNVLADENWSRAEKAGVPLLRFEEDSRQKRLRYLVADADWVVDALLGTGVSRPVAGELLRTLTVLRDGAERRRRHAQAAVPWVETAHITPPQSASPQILAVDVPSGLNGDTGAIDPAAVPADVTITFACPKVGLFRFPGAAYVGKLVVADIGLPAAASPDTLLEMTTARQVADLLPARPINGNKGTFGKTLVIAGSANYTGAPVLAAGGAMRSGAGLVTLAVAEMLHPILASRLVEATFLLLPHELGVLVPDALRVLDNRLGEYDSLLVGPGLGTDPKTVAFVLRLLSTSSVSAKGRLGFVDTTTVLSSRQAALPPLVVDADGLNALSSLDDWPKQIHRPAILTPHPGEMARLLKTSVDQVEADRIGVALRAAREWNVVVVLKGAFTLIAEPEGKVHVNPFATAALATAGTGDVLAGVIAGLLAQGLSPADAAVAGTYLHGAAGQMLAEEIGPSGCVAGDLLPRLPLIMRQLGQGV